jgi:hypothetical protein
MYKDDEVELPITDVLDLHSFIPEDVPDLVRDYLDLAYSQGLCARSSAAIRGSRSTAMRRLKPAAGEPPG